MSITGNGSTISVVFAMGHGVCSIGHLRVVEAASIYFLSAWCASLSILHNINISLFELFKMFFMHVAFVTKPESEIIRTFLEQLLHWEGSC